MTEPREHKLTLTPGQLPQGALALWLPFVPQPIRAVVGNSGPWIWSRRRYHTLDDIPCPFTVGDTLACREDLGTVYPDSPGEFRTGYMGDHYLEIADDGWTATRFKPRGTFTIQSIAVKRLSESTIEDVTAAGFVGESQWSQRQWVDGFRDHLTTLHGDVDLYYVLTQDPKP